MALEHADLNDSLLSAKLKAFSIHQQTPNPIVRNAMYKFLFESSGESRVITENKVTIIEPLLSQTA